VPDAIVQELAGAIAEILEMPDVKQKFHTLGMELVPRDPAGFDAFVADEFARWGNVIAQGKLRID